MLDFKEKFMKHNVTLIRLGHVHHLVNFNILRKWKSELFSITGIESIENLPNSDIDDGFLDIKYRKQDLEKIISCPKNSDYAIAIMPYRFNDNFYMHRISNKCVVISLYGITDILKPEKIEFKVSGKEILEPGWRVVYAKDVKNADDDDTSDNANGNADSGNGAKKEVVEERTLPSFTKGESGEHQPTLTEKWTTPPKYYTEATLLRAMETAGKFVEDEELRAALKENGIGRPSSRAGIIETLFKRHYIRRQRKNLMATPTGIELIDTIHEELLKSCELTGIWEKKLRDIEHKTYDPADFINGLKEQINKIVIDVLSDNSNRRVTIMTEEDLKKKPAAKKTPAKKAPAKKMPAKKKDEATAQNADTQNAAAQPISAPQAPADPMVGKPCPLCGKGVIIKGKTAYGCSNWKAGCQYRQPFSQM